MGIKTPKKSPKNGVKDDGDKKKPMKGKKSVVTKSPNGTILPRGRYDGDDHGIKMCIPLKV